MEKREVVRRGRKVGVYTYIDPEDFEELEKIVRETGMSLSGLVRMVVKEWLRKEKETSQKTLS